MKILAASLDFVGHVAGLRGLFRQALRYGHEGAFLFAAPPGPEIRRLIAGTPIFDLGRPARKANPDFAAIYRDYNAVRRLAWGITELDPKLVHQVERLLDRERIDLVVTDGVSVAALVAAARAGVPYINLPAGFAPFFTRRDGIEFLAANEFAARRAKVFASFGLERHHWVQNYVASPRLNLVMSVPEFLGKERLRVPFPYAAVGSLAYEPPEPVVRNDTPSGLPNRPFVLLCFGTLATGPFCVRAAELVGSACRKLNLDCVVLRGNMAIDRCIPARVYDFLPLDATMQRSVLYVGAGGMNSVNSALLAGLPILSFPMYYDQHDSAELAERSGAGLTLPPAKASALEVETALYRLMREPGFREKANEIGRAMIRVRNSEILCSILKDVPRIAPLPQGGFEAGGGPRDVGPI